MKTKVMELNFISDWSGNHFWAFMSSFPKTKFKAFRSGSARDDREVGLLTEAPLFCLLKTALHSFRYPAAGLKPDLLSFALEINWSLYKENKAIMLEGCDMTGFSALCHSSHFCLGLCFQVPSFRNHVKVLLPHLPDRCFSEPLNFLTHGLLMLTSSESGSGPHLEIPRQIDTHCLRTRGRGCWKVMPLWHCGAGTYAWITSPMNGSRWGGKKKQTKIQ